MFALAFTFRISCASLYYPTYVDMYSYVSVRLYICQAVCLWCLLMLLILHLLSLSEFLVVLLCNLCRYKYSHLSVFSSFSIKSYFSQYCLHDSFLHYCCWLPFQNISCASFNSLTACLVACYVLFLFFPLLLDERLVKDTSGWGWWMRLMNKRLMDDINGWLMDDYGWGWQMTWWVRLVHET